MMQTIVDVRKQRQHTGRRGRATPVWVCGAEVTRRAALVGAAALLLSPSPGRSQVAFPKRDVRLVVPFPPGGPTNVVARIIAEKLSEAWNHAVIVDNKPGAGGAIGSALVARAEPDGHTLVLGNTASHGSFEAIQGDDAPYHTLRDFTGVAMIGTTPLIMVVRSSLGTHNVQEFVAYVKRNPGKVFFGDAGGGPQIACNLLKMKAGIDMVAVPYPGTAPIMTAMMSNTIDMFMGSASSVMPFVESGQLKAVGAVSDSRNPDFPDMPTLKEQGLDVAFDVWYGLLAPAKTPVDVIEKINADYRSVMNNEEVRAQLQKLGFLQRLQSREEFGQLLSVEVARVADVVRVANLKRQ